MGASLFLALAGSRIEAQTGGTIPVYPSNEVKYLPDMPDVPEQMRTAFAKIDEAARAAPDDLAYPWIDFGGGRIVVPAVTAAGLAKARQLTSTLKMQGSAAIADEPVMVRFSIQQLEGMRDQIIALSADQLPDGDFIKSLAVDARKDRLVIGLSARSDRLLDDLAQRFGADALAVRYDQYGVRTNSSRDWDWSPFNGGSAINVIDQGDHGHGWCTSGFPWRVNNTQVGMLTAGHCTFPSSTSRPQTTYYWTYQPQNRLRVQYMGKVLPGWSAYSTERGSLPNSSGQYAGDAALALVTPTGTTVTPYIYVGSPTSGNRRRIAGRLGRRLQDNEGNICIGGAHTGELCGWHVSAVDESVRDILHNTWVRHIVHLRKQGACPQAGDSGAPVYKIRSDGQILAAGIFDGMGENFDGGTDHWGGLLDPCISYISDMHNIWIYFPGEIAH